MKTKTKLSLAIVSAFYLTGCVKYVSGYSRSSGSADAKAEAAPPEEAGEEASAETCLKLQEKRKGNLKLLDEGEEAPAEETAEETAACPPVEEAPADETPTEEAAPE